MTERAGLFAPTIGPINTGESFGAAGYRGYVLTALLVAYVLNFIDRVMIGVVIEGIKSDFLLTDLQLGLLSGFAFALFYTFLGIPIARLSEKVNRVTIIAIAIVVWSAFTALCGLASGFWMLFAFRIGVGVGEAGLTPPANSLISDYFKPASRAQALSIYALGVTIGTLGANLFFGLFGSVLTWQQTFLIIGLAGIPVGVVILFTVKEVPRGYSDLPGTVRPEPAGIVEALKELSTRATFWWVSVGAMLASFVGYGMGTFVISYLVRNHGISIPDAALNYMAPLAVAGAVGTFTCGFLVDRYGGGRPTAALFLAAISLVVASVAYAMAFNVGSAAWIFPLLLLANLFQYWYLGPMYSVVSAVVKARTRATAIAILLFIVNLLGYGLGPLFVGLLSDIFAVRAMGQAGLSSAECNGLAADLADAVQQTCAAASATGLQTSITITVLIFLLAATCFLMAIRTFNKDASAATGPEATSKT